jgi:hypothetical protein
LKLDEPGRLRLLAADEGLSLNPEYKEIKKLIPRQYDYSVTTKQFLENKDTAKDSY